RALADLADLVDPTLRGGVHLDDVEGRPRGDRARHGGRRAEVGGRAALRIQRLRKDHGHRRLPRPARTDEQVSLTRLVVLDRVAEGPDAGFLADDLREV